MSLYNVHESARPLPKSHQPLFDVWLSGQVMLKDVLRWKAWVNVQGTRPQSTLQHTYALIMLTINFVDRLQPFVKLNLELLIRAVAIHDHGEGELHRDVLLKDKTDHQDLQEYLAFVERYKDLPGFPKFRTAFLLQFAEKRPANFPPIALETFKSLINHCPREIAAFQALENLDYLLYAVEQRLIMDNRDCLAQVLLNARPILDRLSPQLPGLKSTFWTPEFIAWCEEMAVGGNTAVPK